MHSLPPGARNQARWVITPVPGKELVAQFRGKLFLPFFFPFMFSEPPRLEILTQLRLPLVPLLRFFYEYIRISLFPSSLEGFCL